HLAASLHLDPALRPLVEPALVCPGLDQPDEVAIARAVVRHGVGRELELEGEAGAVGQVAGVQLGETLAAGVGGVVGGALAEVERDGEGAAVAADVDVYAAAHPVPG